MPNKEKLISDFNLGGYFNGGDQQIRRAQEGKGNKFDRTLAVIDLVKNKIKTESVDKEGNKLNLSSEEAQKILDSLPVDKKVQDNLINNQQELSSSKSGLGSKLEKYTERQQNQSIKTEKSSGIGGI